MSDGKRFHIHTHLERDAADKWYCVCDVGEILATFGNAHLEETQGLRVGPYPSRQVARKELRGKFRDLVLEAVNKFIRKSGGQIERFNVEID